MPKLDSIKEDDIESGLDTLNARRNRGEEAMTEGSDMTRDEEEDETRASDAVSNILTALFGAAGYCVQDSEGWDVHLRDDVVENARQFLNSAFDSWTGDAEDYDVPLPDPTETDVPL